MVNFSWPTHQSRKSRHAQSGFSDVGGAKEKKMPCIVVFITALVKLIALSFSIRMNKT